MESGSTLDVDLAALRAEADTHRPAADDPAVLPFTASAGQDGYLAQVQSRDFSGVALVDRGTGRVVEQVDRFASEEHQAMGFANDRYAVWKETRRLTTLDDFAIKMWDRRRDRVTTLAESGRAADGTPFSSPYDDPALSGHHAAWIEGTSVRQGRGRLVLADLATGRRRVVSDGHPNGYVFYDGLLVWTESFAPDQETETRAVHVRSGRPAVVPAALRDLRGAVMLASDGARAAAWVETAPAKGEDGADSTRSTLYAVGGPAQEPHEVISFDTGGFNPTFQFAGGLLAAHTNAVGTGRGCVLVDVASGARAVLADVGCGGGSGDALLVAPLAEIVDKDAPPDPRWVPLHLDATGRVEVE